MAQPGDSHPPPSELPDKLKPPSKGERNRYDFEVWFTTDPNAKVNFIIFLNLGCVAALSIMFWLCNCLHQLSGTHKLLELMWMSFGKMGGGGGMGPNGFLWPTRVVLIIAGFMKMIAFSMLVNFLGDAIDSRMEALFEGKSRVLEENFTLILGWSDKVLPLVEQICLANESDGGRPIVILADVLSKPDMDNFFYENIEEWYGSKVVTRGGNPINKNDLLKAAAPNAAEIIVLSQGFDPDEADAQACRVCLALTGGLRDNETGLPYALQGHIVVELRDIDNEPVVRLGISEDARNPDGSVMTEEDKDRQVLPLVGANLIGRLMVQCSLEPGLAAVFAHILAFAGNEFYFSEWPELVNKRFADACFMFEDAVCLGIRYKTAHTQLDAPDNPLTYIGLNPPGTDLIEEGDKLIFIAEDNDTYAPGELKLTSCGPPPNVPDQPKPATKTLLIGWRRDMQDMIFEVDKWVSEGSTLAILAEAPSVEERYEELASQDCIPAEHLTNICLEMMVGNPIIRADLVATELTTFNAVLVLTEEREGIPGLSSDSRSMVTMLLVRDEQNRYLAEGLIQKMPVMIAEILDPRTAQLLELASADDSMVSNEFVSMALGQMAMEKDVRILIEDLFCPAGNEMHIKPIDLFAQPGESLSFWELMNRARQRVEIAIGFELAVTSADKQRDGVAEGELILNPPNKSMKVTWMPNDRVVVISED
jgi:hypothetical protein